MPQVRQTSVRILGFALQCETSHGTLERVAVPLPRFGGGLVSALQECKQGRIRIRGGTDFVVGQQELPQRLVVRGTFGLDGKALESGRDWIRVGIENGVIDTVAARPEARTADFV